MVYINLKDLYLHPEEGTYPYSLLKPVVAPAFPSITGNVTDQVTMTSRDKIDRTIGYYKSRGIALKNIM